MSATTTRETLLADTVRAQTAASDPAASVWVSANAGAGKTHVLKSRVLRILLAGTRPDRILCLTYTKAAAAEMSARVFADLATWATADEPALAAELKKLLDRAATDEERTAARKLFARAIETPGGLKVQTIHAFCERLLQRFPLEAGVPPGFAILDDRDGAELRRAATDDVLAMATRDPASDLGRALVTMIAFAAGDGFDEVLAGALSNRDWLETARRAVLDDADGAVATDRIYRRAFAVRDGVTIADNLRDQAAVLDPSTAKRAAIVLRDGGKLDAALADALDAAAAATADAARAAALREALLTAEQEPRSDTRFVSKAVRQEHPEVAERLCKARDALADLVREGHALRVAEASAALALIAGAVMQRYVAAKAARAALDFDDLIARTANLLSFASAAEWVLYKLDGGLDHVLVDEAQDTSPVQWRVIESLASEFFTGANARDVARTVFAVGDEKQSIYSFQGAEPRMFAETGARFGTAAELAGQAWRRVPLTLSFRTVAPLLEAVDHVFADHARTPGVSADATPVRHNALRLGHAGLVEVWEPEAPEERPQVDPWHTGGDDAAPSPASRLASRIADTIAGWISSGERLHSENRPIRAGDVLILVRRRRPFAEPMVAALKSRGIPVAGADRLRLVDQIAVKDLMVLGDFLTLPEDDLALATILKSPLFDLDDDDLMAIAPKRKGTLWSALLEAAKSNPRFAAPAETLKRWRGIADQAPPFELYATVLDRDGGRRRLIERLGPEAVDPIVELVQEAMRFDEAEPPSLTGFLAWLRAGSPEVKRDMEHGRDEVRVLTVHGAKGLEAPIVFLPDTCSGGGGRRASDLVELADTGLAPGSGRMLAWPVKGASRLPAVKAGRDAAAGRETEERNRLLYVALTRARDRLYVAGFHGSGGRLKGCWYDLIVDGLGERLTMAADDTGRPLRRLETPQSAEPEPPRASGGIAVVPLEPPAWARQPAPREPHLSIPLAPSRLAPYDIDETGDPVERQPRPGDAPADPPAPSPLKLAGDNRFQRGLITHALLEHLPALPREGWQRAARAFVASRGTMLPARTRDGIVTETLALLADPAFAAVFGPDSRAEVPIVAEIPAPDGSGPPLRLNGQIDRLALIDGEVLIVDYKTNRPPPAEPEQVASAYLYQLAAYRLALGRVYPGRTVRAAILWTDGPRLMHMPDALLEAHQSRLWALASGNVSVP